MAPQTSRRPARNTASPAFDPVEANGVEPLVGGVEVEPGDVVDDDVAVVVVDDVVEVVEVVDAGGSVVVVVVGGAVVVGGVVVVVDPVTSISTPFGSWVPPSLSVAPKKAV